MFASVTIKRASLSQLFPFLSAPEFSLQDQAGENKPDTA